MALSEFDLPPTNDVTREGLECFVSVNEDLYGAVRAHDIPADNSQSEVSDCRRNLLLWTLNPGAGADHVHLTILRSDSSRNLTTPIDTL